jgi:hypothetical protein
MPPQSSSVLQPQRRPDPENKPAAAAAIPHARRTEVQPKHECPDIRPANVLYSCIDRVSGLRLPSTRLRGISTVGSIPAVKMAAMNSRSAIWGISRHRAHESDNADAVRPLRGKQVTEIGSNDLGNSQLDQKGILKEIGR